jgi:hypothetical protein
MSADRVANEAGSRDAAVRRDGVAGPRGTDVDAMPVRPARMENRRYVRAHDYFQGAVGDLPGLGLEPVAAVTDMPHKAWLGTALVIARKQTAPRAAT